ncbi:MAG TPA: CpsD/CapB family tyrosine-protein kinase [Methylomirabilota bacterium]|nr:CpsD/CapB family tyrosine-protein kinase [Methylomirabilota bacterium]
MSKYFDETLKARNAPSPLEGLKVSTMPEVLEAASLSKSAFPDVGSKRLEQCGKIEIPLSKVLHAQFHGSEALKAAEESYRALRTRLLRLRAAQGLRSVVITSPVQGEGKTLTSLNLALCCAQLRDMRILLVDGDIRSQGLTRLFGSAQTPGLAEVLAGQCKPEQAVLATDLPNLYVFPAGNAATPPPELFASSHWQEFVGWCNESFKLVLIDSPPTLDLADVELIAAACDGVLMVVRAGQTRRDALRKSAAQIDAKKLLGAVFNSTNHSSHHPYQYVGGP